MQSERRGEKTSQAAYGSRALFTRAAQKSGRRNRAPKAVLVSCGSLFFSWAVGCGATRVSNAGRSAAAAPSPEVRRPRPALSLGEPQGEGGPADPLSRRRNVGSGESPPPAGRG